MLEKPIKYGWSTCAIEQMQMESASFLLKCSVVLHMISTLPFLQRGTTFSLKFWKQGNEKKMNAWRNLKSSCHSY